MRLKNRKSLSLIVFALMISTLAFSQGPNQGKCRAVANIPDLTEEQQTKIDALKAPHLKVMLENRTELDKLNAELKALEIADQPDMAKINAKIDEISAVKTKMAKERSKHRQDVRVLLTDEQKVYFDSHRRGPEGKGQGGHRCGGKGPAHGYGPGNGPCKVGSNG